MIMNKRRNDSHAVLPVFYDVSPSQVKRQTESFASSFSKHEKHFKGETDKINRWRTALNDAADLSGMELKDGYEAKFNDDIVREVRNKLHPRKLDLTSHLVGIDLRVTEIKGWLNDETHEISMGQIYGIGGIGKTTIAKFLYNENLQRFESSSFVSKVKDASKDQNGLIRLQKQLLSDILKGKKHDLYDAEGGIVKIQNAICCKKVLIFLDDVDDSNQLEALFGKQRLQLYPGSKIILTSRYDRLNWGNQYFKKFEIKALYEKESLELFSWHAFCQNHPIDSYLEFSKEATQWCGGLPLALKVVGSSLYRRDIDVWKCTLKKLQVITHCEVQRILRVSYDSLEDDRDRALFLDIACFFVGKEKNYVTAILDGCGFHAASGILNLVDRCLLSVQDDNTLSMHQLLKEMGREVVRQESPDDPGKRSRLWKHGDAFTVLQDGSGSKNIKGLVIDLHRMRGSNYVFNQQSMNVASSHPFPLSGRIDFQIESFRKMRKLQLLQLFSVNLRGDYKLLPKNIVELCWHGFSLKCMPRNFQMEKLVSLDLSYSRIISVWDGTMVLPKLKFLNLSHCQQLTRVPNFGESPYVESLILRGCINIFEVNESIECLKGLLILNLEDCTSLKRLPKSLTTFESLEEINLSGCSNLEEMPEDLRKMKSLKVFNASGITISTITSKETSIASLLSFALWHPTVQSWLTPCKRLLSSTLWHPTDQSWLTPRTRLCSTKFSLTSLPSSLVELTLQNCNLSNDAFPSDLSCLGSLTSLNLSGNLFHSLPESISSLHVLKSLVLDRCRALQSLSKLPVNLQKLDAQDCSSLERIESSIPTFSFFAQSENLVKVKTSFKIYPIDHIGKGILRSLGLPNLESMSNIKEELYNEVTQTRMRTSLQVVHEEVKSQVAGQGKLDSFYNIFLPGDDDIPNRFSLQPVDPKFEKFIYNIHPVGGHKICGFNLCMSHTIDLSHHNYKGGEFQKLILFSIHNKTNKNHWSYKPKCYGIPRDGENILWFIHWKFGDELIKVNDHVDICVQVIADGFDIKSIGVSLDYEADPNYVHQEETSLDSDSGGDSLFSHKFGQICFYVCQTERSGQLMM